MRRVVALVVVTAIVGIGLAACSNSGTGGTTRGGSGPGRGVTASSTVAPTVNTDDPISKARNGVNQLNQHEQ